MTRTEIGALVEMVVKIKERYAMDSQDKDALTDICNLVICNENKLSDK